MSNPEREKELIFLHAIRGIAYHVSKIGDLIGKCAEDTENLIRDPHQPQPQQYPSKAPTQPSHGPAVDEIAVHPRQPHWPKPRQEHLHRYHFPNRSDRHHLPHSSYYYPSDYVMPIQRNYMPADHELDDHDADRFHRKRRASTADIGMDPFVHRMAPEDGKVPRPKRVRINWTPEENKVFFDTVKSKATLDEQSLIREIVASMGGKRNWTQCKGHFRNLVFVNKIILDEKTKHWSVNPDAKRPIRAGVSPRGDEDQSGSDGEVQPGDKVENGKSQPLKEAPAEEEEDLDKDEDEDEPEDVELGGEEDEGDEEYPTQGDGEDGEVAQEDNQETNELPTVDAAKKTNGEEDTDTKSGASGVEQARTRILKGTRTEGRLVADKSPRHANGERRVSEGEEGSRTMPHRKQVMSAKTENGAKPYITPPRRLREMKRRNTADYRPSSYAEGRRYLK